MSERTIERIWTPESSQKLSDFIKEQPYGSKFKLTYTLENGQELTKEQRLSVSLDEKPVIMKTAKSKYGYLLKTKNLKKISYKILTPLGRQIDFNKKCKKIIGMLEESGLWPEIRLELIIMMNLGYEKCIKLKEKYEKVYKHSLYPKLNEEAFEKEYEESRLIFEEIKSFLRNPEDKQKLENKIPKIKKMTEEGYQAYLKKEGQPNYFSLYSLTNNLDYIDNKIKKMVFHKGNNRQKTLRIQSKIKEAIEKKVEYKETSQNGYDVSFHYDPKLNKAWYSEEYKDCANGHYYLALNSTHAWFYEDD